MIQAQAISSVRRLIEDGQTQDATPVLYNLVREESLTAQIPQVPTPTATVFLVRFVSVAVQEYVTVFAVPGTLRAYLDGSSSPTTPTVDVDVNGNFTLVTPPVSSLFVTYGWQFFADTDILDFIDHARSWVGAYAALGDIPDGLNPAVYNYAAGEATAALARKCRLADASAGNAKVNLSQLAQGYEKDSADFYAKAETARLSFVTQADARQAPTAAAAALAIGNYQPPR